MVCDMGIRIQCEAGTVVSQHTGYCFHISAGLQSQGRERMPLRYNNDKRKKP